GLLEFTQDPAAGFGIALARLAQPDRARRSVKQLHADLRLEECNGPAYGRGRAAKRTTGASKTAFVQGCDEDAHGIDPVHDYSVSRKNDCLLASILPALSTA